ncbi:MAG: DUF4845 domain-containing protein [Gammaproteobacteria bacterium]
MTATAGSRLALASARGVVRRCGQGGLSLVGLLLVAAFIIVLAIIALRVAPSAIEYFAIRDAVEKVAASGAASVRDVQSAFDRQAAVDDISSIAGRDLIIERINGGTAVSFAYEKRVPLFGPVSLIIDYHGTSRGR